VPRGGDFRLRNHVQRAIRLGEDDHEPLGYVDLDTGELLATTGIGAMKVDDPEGFRAQQESAHQARRQKAAARRAAKEAARAEGREEGDEEGEDSPAPSRDAGGTRPSPPAKPGGTKAKAGGEAPDRKARVLTRDLDLSEMVEFLFRLDMDAFPQAFDPRSWTDLKVRADDMSQWIEEMAILAHLHVPQLRQVYDEMLGRLGYVRDTRDVEVAG